MRVEGLGFRVRVQGSGFRVQGSGFRVLAWNPEPYSLNPTRHNTSLGVEGKRALGLQLEGLALGAEPYTQKP